jgi:hypothetical protein
MVRLVIWEPARAPKPVIHVAGEEQREHPRSRPRVARGLDENPMLVPGQGPHAGPRRSLALELVPRTRSRAERHLDGAGEDHGGVGVRSQPIG